MITALEARELSAKNNNVDQILNDIGKCIEMQASAGYRYLNYSLSPTSKYSLKDMNNVKRILSECGYALKKTENLGNETYRINW